ncbi:hypothetical protein [Pseudonocardia sp. ICBG162]|uniref:hypothetical protein n=1 Tax=Pseudonocardia sp. ICBG162 TaxID=2846761 RepID=UPI001CF63CAF|nr:hypothetical protein [Pseudonocardia sp. ICBG162]
MSRVFPYRRPPADVLSTGPWLLVGEDSLHELGHEISDWDYGTTLRLRRPLRVDGLRARRSCGLGPDAELDLSVVWSSSSSGLRGLARRQGLPAADDVPVEIEFELPGDELGGRLDLRTVVTLRSAGQDTPSPISPRRPGSTLWSDEQSVLLQGDAVLFPLSVVDFSTLPYPDGATWHLELGHDLEAQALGSILLLANERRGLVTRALAAAADPTDADRRVLSTIRTDVIRSLVEQALVDDHFDPDEAHPAGSVGALLAAVLRTAFPDRTVEALRTERRHDPILFTSRVQHATQLLAGP